MMGKKMKQSYESSIVVEAVRQVRNEQAGVVDSL